MNRKLAPVLLALLSLLAFGVAPKPGSGPQQTAVRSAAGGAAHQSREDGHIIFLGDPRSSYLFERLASSRELLPAEEVIGRSLARVEHMFGDDLEKDFHLHKRAMRRYVAEAYLVVVSQEDLDHHPYHVTLVHAAMEAGVPVVLTDLDEETSLQLIGFYVPAHALVVESDPETGEHMIHVVGGPVAEPATTSEVVWEHKEGREGERGDEIEDGEEDFEPAAAGVRVEERAWTPESAVELIETIVAERPLRSGAMEQQTSAAVPLCNPKKQCVGNNDCCWSWWVNLSATTWYPENGAQRSLLAPELQIATSRLVYSDGSADRFVTLRSAGSVAPGIFLYDDYDENVGWFLWKYETTLDVTQLPDSSWTLLASAPDNANDTGNLSVTNGYSWTIGGGASAGQSAEIGASGPSVGASRTVSASGSYTRTHSETTSMPIKQWKVFTDNARKPDAYWRWEQGANGCRVFDPNNKWGSFQDDDCGADVCSLPAISRGGFQPVQEAIWHNRSRGSSGYFKFTASWEMHLRHTWLDDDDAFSCSIHSRDSRSGGRNFPAQVWVP